MMTELTEFAEAHAEAMCKQLRHTRRTTPTFACVGADGKMTVVLYPEFGNPNNKPMMTAHMKEIVEENCASMYVFIMEAWLAKRPTTAPLPGQEGFVLPSEDPNTGEAIMVIGSTTDGENIMWAYEIERIDGKPRTKPRMDMSAAAALISSPLANLFRKPETVN
jgi:hypothetical protein